MSRYKGRSNAKAIERAALRDAFMFVGGFFYGRQWELHRSKMSTGVIMRITGIASPCAFAGCLLLSCWIQPATAIVGDATSGNPFDDAYHVVQIYDSNGGFCTGTVLTRDTVLTAARCVTPGLGFQVSKIDSLAVSIPVTNVMYHPQFDVREMNQQRATVDLAILKLAAPLPLFIYTPSLGVSTAVGDRLTIIGYGDNNNQGYLRSATLMVTGKPGRLQIRLFDARTQDASPGLGACTGDSGGPAIKKSGGEVALVGITVWATAPRGERGCGGLTGLVPISPYEDWIIAAVTKLGGSVTSSVSRPTQAPSSAGLQASRGSISVQMKKDGGTYVVPVLINNAITLDFVLDSGAADVSVPADVFRTLVRTGSIKGSDITGKQTYVLADGSKLQSPTFLIRSLKVGDTLVENVRGSVASTEGSLLLGQSFLERFKSWSIDNSNHELLLKQQ